MIIDVPSGEAKRECVTERHRDVVIMLDAGHGGEEPGAIAVNGVYEKDIVLSISKKVKANIERHSGFKVLMSIMLMPSELQSAAINCRANDPSRVRAYTTIFTPKS